MSVIASGIIIIVLLVLARNEIGKTQPRLMILHAN